MLWSSRGANKIKPIVGGEMSTVVQQSINEMTSKEMLAKTIFICMYAIITTQLDCQSDRKPNKKNMISY